MRIESVVNNLTQNYHRSYTTNSNEQNQDVAQHQQPVNNLQDVEIAVENLNTFVKPLQANLKFQLHEDLNEYYVEIVDPVTEEVIKEIPPKKLLDMYAAMAEFMGILIDKKI